MAELKMAPYADPRRACCCQLFRRRVLRFHGIPLDAPPPVAHQLLLVRKKGRRSIANFESVRSFLAAGCGGQCGGVAVVVADFQMMSVRKQLELVHRSTIALSPPGAADAESLHSPTLLPAELVLLAC